VACPAGRSACRVTVLVVARARPGRTAPVLARATLTIRPRKTTTIVVAFTRKGARVLRRERRVRAVMKLTATRAGATPVSVQRSVTLRRPANR
jgi:hypothetical protein